MMLLGGLFTGKLAYSVVEESLSVLIAMHGLLACKFEESHGKRGSMASNLSMCLGREAALSLGR